MVCVVYIQYELLQLLLLTNQNVSVHPEKDRQSNKASVLPGNQCTI